MKRTICLMFLSVMLILSFTACSSKQTQEADTTDETVLSTPQQENGITGIWSSSFGTLIQNNFFYGSGELVSYTQDQEGETWCMLTYWSQKDNDVSIKDPVYYKYDSASGQWLKSEEPIGFNKATTVSSDELEITELLPDGTTQAVPGKREELDMQIPAELEINGIINEFLIA